MDAHEEQYVVDRNGNRVGVVLNMEEYQKLLAEVEELESIRAFDQAKASAERPLPFEQPIAAMFTGKAKADR